MLNLNFIMRLWAKLNFYIFFRKVKRGCTRASQIRMGGFHQENERISVEEVSNFL